jgi:hypothetical protein
MLLLTFLLRTLRLQIQNLAQHRAILAEAKIHLFKLGTFLGTYRQWNVAFNFIILMKMSSVLVIANECH